MALTIKTAQQALQVWGRKPRPSPDGEVSSDRRRTSGTRVPLYPNRGTSFPGKGISVLRAFVEEEHYDYQQLRSFKRS